MVVAGLVLCGLAALVHGFIFYLESFAWTGPRARAVFGTTAEEAAALRLMAFNQGFYNLFLAIVTAVGIAAIILGCNAVGLALIFAGIGSMAAAALVLLLSSPEKARAAITQGILPVLGIAALLIGSLG